MSKVLFVLTNRAQLGDTDKKTGWYLPEAAHPYQVLHDANVDIDFTSPNGGYAPVDPNSVEKADDISTKFLNSDAFEKTKNTLNPSDIDFKDYQAIYFVGGHGTMWDFPNSKALEDIASKIYENGGVVAAVCHGPAGLVNIRLSNGEYLVTDKELACFTNQEEAAVKKQDIVPFLLESKLIERGANVKTADDWQKNVIVSERIVTGQNPASAEGVGKAILDLL